MSSDTSATGEPEQDISSGGSRLQSFLDGLPVEAEWIAGHHVVWQTGQQNAPDGVGPEAHTHCSAFTGAVALYLDIYILRPPHHAQELLANAQMAWLGGQSYPGPSAADSQWQSLGSSGDAGALDRAVAAANAGKLVVGGYLQPPVIDPVTKKPTKKPGHVVIIRPQSGAVAADTGPLVTMAGDRNWRSIHMANAFSSHPGAWPDAIRLFVHDTDLELDFTPPASTG